MLKSFLLCNLVFVVDLTVSALIGLPVGWYWGLESFPGKVDQSLIFRKVHPQDLNRILPDFFLCRLIIRVDFFNERFRVLLLKLILLVDVVHLVVGHELLLVHFLIENSYFQVKRNRNI